MQSSNSNNNNENNNNNNFLNTIPETQLISMGELEDALQNGLDDAIALLHFIKNNFKELNPDWLAASFTALKNYFFIIKEKDIPLKPDAYYSMIETCSLAGRTFPAISTMVWRYADEFIETFKQQAPQKEETKKQLQNLLLMQKVNEASRKKMTETGKFDGNQIETTPDIAHLTENYIEANELATEIHVNNKKLNHITKSGLEQITRNITLIGFTLKIEPNLDIEAVYKFTKCLRALIIFLLFYADIKSIDKNELNELILKLIEVYFCSESLLIDLLYPQHESTKLFSLALISKFMGHSYGEHISLTHEQHNRLYSLWTKSFDLILIYFPNTEATKDITTYTYAALNACYVNHLSRAIDLLEQGFLLLKDKDISDENIFFFITYLRIATSFSKLNINGDLNFIQKIKEMTMILIENRKKLAIRSKSKNKVFLSAYNFWVDLALQLKENKRDLEGLKYLLFALEEVCPFLDEASIPPETLKTLLKSIPFVQPILQQLKTNESEFEVALSLILKLLTHLLKAKMLNEFYEQLELVIEKCVSLPDAPIVLQKLIESLPPEESKAQLKLKFAYLKLCSSGKWDETQVEKIIQYLNDYHKYYKKRNNQSDDGFSELFTALNHRLAAWANEHHQTRDAICFYNAIIKSTTSEQNKGIAVTEANKLLFALIAQCTSSEPFEAINLCDEIIKNAELVNAASDKLRAINEQLNALVQYAQELLTQEKFTNVLLLCEQQLAKPIYLNNEPLQSLKLKAQSGLVTQVKIAIDQATEQLSKKEYSLVLAVCDKSLKKLKSCQLNESIPLIKELKKIRQLAQNEIDYRQKTLFNTPETTSKNIPDKKEAVKKLEAQLKVDENNNNNNAANEVILQYENAKVGSRVEAPFLKKGTANLFTVLKIDIPNFNKKDKEGLKPLKKENLLLYKGLKRVAMEGGVCRKHGQFGIKYLGNGMWEAKYYSKARLFGHTEQGLDGNNYIVFDTYSKVGLHKKK